MVRESRVARGLQVLALLLLFAQAPSAFAACSDERIRRMSEQGRTVATIARICKMDKEEVQAVLDESSEEDSDERPQPDDRSSKLPRGAPVGQCGCWGFADPNHRQPHQACRSGFARPAMCNAPCPAGGFMWRGVCT